MELLQKAEVSPVYTEFRVKDPDSLKRKLERGEKDCETVEELHAVGDLAGVRGIFLLREQVDRAAEVLRPEFRIEKPERHWEPEQPEFFGYVTCQWTVSLDEDRARLSDWSDHRHRQGEIQLRTLLQHAWAEVNHPWAYKAIGARPVELRRRFARLAAILEIADSELEALVEASSRLKEYYLSEISNNNLAIELNADSLEVYLRKNDYLASVVDVAVQIGYQFDEELRGRPGRCRKVHEVCDCRQDGENRRSRCAGRNR